MRIPNLIFSSRKTVSDLFMPLSGEVIEVNAGLDNSPESVNNDAYGEGWMIKVKMSSASEVSGLMSAADYKTLVNA
jgi:glycine cleavage system H protein